MSEAHKPLKFVPSPGQSQDSVSDQGQSASESALNEQMAQHLQLLNSQLVLYARDFRRLVDDQQRKDDELQAVKHQLDTANQQLKDFERHSQSMQQKRSPAKTTIDIIGQSKTLSHILKLCQRVAPSQTTVMITGETGTGKELTARYIHQHSSRHDKPFIAVNCGALPESLMESELFGHAKGAFTGADSDKTGLVELAAGGTLMLDEIYELPLTLQVKLLRVLEERTYRKVGSGNEVDADVRVIAATNRELKQEVAQGRFRADLMYRLNVFPIELPPLRLRSEDVPPLVEHFLSQRPMQYNGQVTVSMPALLALKQYDWPGNVRELRNVLERAALLCDHGIIEVDMLGPEFADHSCSNGTNPSADGAPIAAASSQTTTGGTKSILAQQERSMIEAALEQANWNKAAAARLLGISWDNLRYRIKKYKITKPEDQ
ncbi:MAG TPA: sigma-54-dependent Fis family transcriptional regulator [Phycisphaerales bacterium]|nr:sigma-54-dependent Fis family transcriptional regulator [Phycisphaerales bacterium]